MGDCKFSQEAVRLSGFLHALLKCDIGNQKRGTYRGAVLQNGPVLGNEGPLITLSTFEYIKIWITHIE